MPHLLERIENAALRLKLACEIHAILTSNAAQRINFTLSFVHVDGKGLQAVADAIVAKLKNQNGVEISLGDATPGAAGSYNSATNRISVPTGFATQSWKSKQVLLHECVHAMQDILGGGSGLNLRGARRLTLQVDNEAAAYVAGALYFIYGSGRAYRTTHPIYLTAQQIAFKICDKPGAWVEPADVFALRAAIKSRPLYANLASDPRSPVDGL